MSQTSVEESLLEIPESEQNLDAKPRRKRGLGLLSAPIGAFSTITGRLLKSGVDGANALQHEPAAALAHHATNVLSHQPVEAAAVAVAAPPPATPPPSPGPPAPAIAAGAGVAVAAAAVVAVIALGGEPAPEPEPEPPAPTTTAAPAPPPNVPAIATAATAALQPVGGQLFAETNAANGAAPLLVTAVAGELAAVGSPFILPSGATVTVQQDGSFQYEPGQAFAALGGGESAIDEFTYSVTDESGWTEEWTLAVTVTGVNQPPVFTEPQISRSLTEGTTATLALVVTDPDLTVAAEADAAAATDAASPVISMVIQEPIPGFATLVDAGDGTASLALSPGASDVGTHEIVVTATDSGTPAESTTSTITVTVVAAPLQRVTTSLVSLYDFNESTGLAIGDAAGSDSPNDLVVADESAVRWVDTGLLVEQPTIISSGDSAFAASDAIVASNELTIEAWVTPSNTTQAGPARIVSISSGTSLRNATLGQGDPDGVGGDHWSARLRSTGTSQNGTPALISGAGSVVAEQLTHLVMTRSTSGVYELYVNGVLTSTGAADGDLSNWDNAFPLVLANETTLDRPWLGTFHLVAVYAKALTSAEVAQNHQVGI